MCVLDSLTAMDAFCVIYMLYILIYLDSWDLGECYRLGQNFPGGVLGGASPPPPKKGLTAIDSVSAISTYLKPTCIEREHFSE